MWEKQISSTCLYDGAILRVEKDEVELEDGSRSIREVVHNSGGVAVLAIDAQEKVILEMCIRDRCICYREKMSKSWIMILRIRS